jgi:hypothetical protein
VDAKALCKLLSVTTLYVSKLGNNSDGRSWRTAFRTIQAALDAIPDDLGGHRVIIRPDTYAEANLDSKHGAVYSDLAGKFLHVDFEGCTVMGYRVLGARKDDLFSYTTKGTNRAYVQYRQ